MLVVHALPQVLEPEVLYSVREGGELSEGETHWLTGNNPVLLPTGQVGGSHALRLHHCPRLLVIVIVLDSLSLSLTPFPCHGP